jgi:phytoene dehydrogenase-like protein
MEGHADIVVVGGGLAGLITAVTAAGADADSRLDVVVLEGTQPGGRARTDERSGFRFNQGAHAVYLGGALTRTLGSLGIDPRGGPPAINHSFVWHEGALYPLPFSARKLLASRLLGARAKAQMAKLITGLGKIDPASLSGITAAQWLDSLELQPEARQLVSLLARTATYADPDALPISADATVAQLQMAASPGVRYIDGGWQTLVDQLLGVCEARGVRVETKTPVLSVRSTSGGVEITTSTGGWTARAGVIAGLGPAGASTLLGGDPGWGELGDPATAACLDMGLTRPPAHPIAFGFADPLYLSTHCPPADLAPKGGAVVHAMRYGARGADVDRAALDELATAAGIDASMVVTERFLARMNVAWTVPTASRGGLPGRPSIAVPGHDAVFVAGDWVGPEGLLSEAVAASGVSAANAARACASALAGAR